MKGRYKVIFNKKLIKVKKNEIEDGKKYVEFSIDT